MKIRYGLIVLLMLWYAALTEAATYKWTDDHGVDSFTDDPALIPSRYRDKALKVKDAAERDPKLSLEQKKQPEKKNGNRPATPRSVTGPASVQSTPAPPGMQQTIKGHLGGDQTDPAPPSMKQPIPVDPGEQPKPASPGMKQPIPVPTGVQPKPAPSGMKQPTPAPPGNQPSATPLGMEQPTSKQ
jgi:hypothetical protein